MNDFLTALLAYIDIKQTYVIRSHLIHEHADRENPDRKKGLDEIHRLQLSVKKAQNELDAAWRRMAR